MPDRAALVLSRRNRRLDRRRAHDTRMRMGGIGLGILLSFLIAILILLGALAYADLTRDLPNVALLPALLNPPDGLLLQPTRVYDRTGQHLLYTFDVPASERSDAAASSGDGSAAAASPALSAALDCRPAASARFPGESHGRDARSGILVGRGLHPRRPQRS